MATPAPPEERWYSESEVLQAEVSAAAESTRLLIRTTPQPAESEGYLDWVDTAFLAFEVELSPEVAASERVIVELAVAEPDVAPVYRMLVREAAAASEDSDSLSVEVENQDFMACVYQQASPCELEVELWINHIEGPEVSLAIDASILLEGSGTRGPSVELLLLDVPSLEEAQHPLF